MKTYKRVTALFILGALLLSTVTPVLGAPNLAGLTASIGFEAPGCDQFQVEFTFLATGGVKPYDFAWDFDDGSAEVIENTMDATFTVTHTYEAAGTYTVTLTVTDSVETAEASKSVTIKENPKAKATADPERAILDESTGEATIDFTFSATGGVKPYDFAWDFDDGSDPQIITDTLTATFAVTHTYTMTGTYHVTLNVTDALECPDEDTVVVTVSSEEAENWVGDMLARFFNITNDEINGLRDEGWGYGEIAIAYFAAQLSGEDPATIIELRQAGSGWGEIFKDTVGFAGLHGYNLGLIVSGREVPAPIQNLADICQMEVEELTELLQDTGGKFATVKMACRLAQQVEDEEVTVESIIEMRQEGMSWREIKVALGLLPEPGSQGQGSQGKGKGPKR